MEITLRTDANPLLLTFPQNVPSKQLDLELMESTTKQKKRAVLLRNDLVSYVGKSDPQAPQLLVGLVSRELNKIDLYPTFGHFTLQQFIHKQIGGEVTLLAQNTMDRNLSHFEQQVMVAEEMGTNKSRRKVNAMKNNRVQEANISQAKQTEQMFLSKQEDLQEQVETESKVTKELKSAHQNELLPHFNPNETKKLSAVYDITSLISQEDMEAIEIQHLYVGIIKKPERLLQCIKPMNQFVQNIVLGQLERIQAQTQTEIIIFLKHIVFLESMLLFVNRQKFTNMDPESIARQLRTNIQLVKTILAKFYQAVAGQQGQGLTYTKSSKMKDKYICHLIVLVLTLTNFVFEGDVLSSILKLPPTRFALYAKQCGCTTTNVKQKSGDTVMKVKLTLPLKLS